MCKVMELAASTLFCLHEPLEKALPDIVQVGTRCIELVDAGPHTLTRPRVDRLLELKSSYALRYSLHAPFTDVNLAADDASIREAILRRIETSIRWASALDAEVYVFHPGNLTAAERFSPGCAWNLNLSSVRRILRYAGDYGVRAMIENVPEPFPWLLKSVDDFEMFFEQLDMDTEIVLDVAHAHLRGEVIEFIERLGERIGHVHVSDNNGDADKHLRIGEGSIDWVQTISALKSAPFDGWVTIESYYGLEESLRMLKSLF